MKNESILIACAITAVIAGGVGFVAHAKLQSKNQFANWGERGESFRMMEGKEGKGRGMGQGMMGRGGAQSGEVTAKDGKTLTLKMSDGSTKLVILSDTTTYRAAVESSLDKVEVGTKIAAFGTQSTDGSTVATSIEINPLSLRQ